jgi:hypothetical protein
VLSKDEVNGFFKKDYLKDLEGVDIDPKFLELSLKAILSEDTN